MTQTLRTFLMTVVALLLGAGLAACAVFLPGTAAASVSAAADAPASEMPMAGHAHHADHAEHGGPQPDAPAHHQDGEACEACAQSVLHRVDVTPETISAPTLIPAPVFVLPAALSLDPPAVLPDDGVWPPGLGPPLEPSTLTHQNISLLI